MSDKTLTRSDLSEAVYRKIGLSRRESAQLVESVLNEICDAIIHGETVKISSFATFQIRQKKERVGRNPKTREEVLISPRKVIIFKPSNILKKRIINGYNIKKEKN